MDAGADANAADYDKRSAMHLASAEGHLAVVQFLVERQADINITDRWGRYPLKEAVFNGHSEVQLLPNNNFNSVVVLVKSDADSSVRMAGARLSDSERRADRPQGRGGAVAGAVQGEREG
eukprot:2661972-Rhodomonas_salina.1